MTDCTCGAPLDAEPEDHDLNCPESPYGETDCVWDGEVWPEHDFPPPGEGNECRRCGAEADDPEEG